MIFPIFQISWKIAFFLLFFSARIRIKRAKIAIPSIFRSQLRKCLAMARNNFDSPTPAWTQSSTPDNKLPVAENKDLLPGRVCWKSMGMYLNSRSYCLSPTKRHTNRSNFGRSPLFPYYRPKRSRSSFSDRSFRTIDRHRFQRRSPTLVCCYSKVCLVYNIISARV